MLYWYCGVYFSVGHRADTVKAMHDGFLIIYNIKGLVLI